jgi:hypothetical protein
MNDEKCTTCDVIRKESILCSICKEHNHCYWKDLNDEKVIKEFMEDLEALIKKGYGTVAIRSEQAPFILSALKLR